MGKYQLRLKMKNKTEQTEEIISPFVPKKGEIIQYHTRESFIIHMFDGEYRVQNVYHNIPGYNNEGRLESDVIVVANKIRDYFKK